MRLPINIHFSVDESGILLGGCTEGSVGEYGGEEFGGGEKIGQGQLKVWKPNWANGPLATVQARVFRRIRPKCTPQGACGG